MREGMMKPGCRCYLCAGLWILSASQRDQRVQTMRRVVRSIVERVGRRGDRGQAADVELEPGREQDGQCLTPQDAGHVPRMTDAGPR
jgi:hypothetical protein